MTLEAARNRSKHLNHFIFNISCVWNCCKLSSAVNVSWLEASNKDTSTFFLRPSQPDIIQLILGHNQLTQMWHRILGVFLTFFAVFPSEPFADTLVIIFFVHWQTLAVVLTGPTSAGCLQKNMYYDASF